MRPGTGKYDKSTAHKNMSLSATWISINIFEPTQIFYVCQDDINQLI